MAIDENKFQKVIYDATMAVYGGMAGGAVLKAHENARNDFPLTPIFFFMTGTVGFVLCSSPNLFEFRCYLS